MSAQFTMRMTLEARAKLDEAAREHGFKDAKALVMHRLRDDLGERNLMSEARVHAGVTRSSNPPTQSGAISADYPVTANLSV